MGMTIVEKILAAHSGRETVTVGDIVDCEVDVAVMIDYSFSTLIAGEPFEILRVDHPERVVVLLDHAVPAPTIADATYHQAARAFVKRFGVERFRDVGNGGGICHQVILESGLARPGQILTCADSHTIASGALNCAARGLGPAEILQVVCTGRTWFRAAPTIKYELSGQPSPGVFGKDIFLHLAGRDGSVEGHNLEFAGEGLANLSMDDRATIATMCQEISADFATFPADDMVVNHVRRVTGETVLGVEADANATYVDVRTLNLTDVRPRVALPGHVPHNTVPVAELGEEVRVDQAFVGSCANGKLEDLRVAANVVTGRKVAPGVRFIVTPASQKVYLDAVRLGYVETLVEAGAVVTNATCGACPGGHLGVLAPGEVCVTSSTRNFKGRMGSPDAQVYIASSATVAASAIAGRIADASALLERGVAR
jgi:3-isopropylmalate/(R)-2-methylmalate dehydratase large subunit